MREFLNTIDPMVFRILLFVIVVIVLYVTAKRVLNQFYPRLQEQDKWYFTKKIVMNTLYLLIFLVIIVTFYNSFWVFIPPSA